MKCNECGFDNAQLDICSNCGAGLPRYIKDDPWQATTHIPLDRVGVVCGNMRRMTIGAVWRAIDPSQEGIARQCYEKARDAILALPMGTFSDETGKDAP